MEIEGLPIVFGVALVVGLTEAVQRWVPGLKEKTKWHPLLALLVSVGAAFSFFAAGLLPGPASHVAIKGVGVALMAMGLFSGTKATAGK